MTHRLSWLVAGTEIQNLLLLAATLLLVWVLLKKVMVWIRAWLYPTLMPPIVAQHLTSRRQRPQTGNIDESEFVLVLHCCSLFNLVDQLFACICCKRARRPDEAEPIPPHRTSDGEEPAHPSRLQSRLDKSTTVDHGTDGSMLASTELLEPVAAARQLLAAVLRREPLPQYLIGIPAPGLAAAGLAGGCAILSPAADLAEANTPDGAADAVIGSDANWRPATVAEYHQNFKLQALRATLEEAQLAGCGKRLLLADGSVELTSATDVCRGSPATLFVRRPNVVTIVGQVVQRTVSHAMRSARLANTSPVSADWGIDTGGSGSLADMALGVAHQEFEQPVAVRLKGPAAWFSGVAVVLAVIIGFPGALLSRSDGWWSASVGLQAVVRHFDCYECNSPSLACDNYRSKTSSLQAASSLCCAARSQFCGSSASRSTVLVCWQTEY
eukprot:SAG31_NODE_1366_length_8621_cov_4.579911_7_plen_441_part_00